MQTHEQNDVCRELFGQMKEHITESISVRSDVEKSKEKINSLEKRLDGFDSLKMAVYGTLFAIIVQTGAICFYAGKLSNQVGVNSANIEELKYAAERIRKEYNSNIGKPVDVSFARGGKQGIVSIENKRGSNPHDLDYVGGIE